MSRRPEPLNCDGCHDSDFADFDHFCDILDIQTHELPQAFAAWLSGNYEWDGEYGPIGLEGEE